MTLETEIERRFVVKSVDSDVFQGPCVYIDQGYIEKNLRVRVQSDEVFPRCTLTLKTGKGLVRQELTEKLDHRVATMLLDSTKYRLQKMRYFLDDWELDVYENKLKGLIIAERECKTEDEAHALVLPTWLKDSVEVTDTLTNRQLAKMAYFIDDVAVSSSLPLSLAQNVLTPGVPRIVLTGAPCSGKSTALARLKTEDSTLHCVPETATIILGQIQVTPAIGTPLFQHTIRRVQKSFEDAAAQQALKNQRRAVILDRGTLDSAAFMGGVENYETMMRTERVVEYERYTAVIMLGLPNKEVFELEKTNNSVRRETYEEAREVEASLYKIWSRHPRFSYVGDYPTWEEKFEAVRWWVDGGSTRG